MKICPKCDGLGRISRIVQNPFGNDFVLAELCPCCNGDCFIDDGKGFPSAGQTETIEFTRPLLPTDIVKLIKPTIDKPQTETVGPATTWHDDYDPYDPYTHELGHA